MSRFVTHIPVDIKSITDQLPAGRFVESVVFNKEQSRVEVTWEHHKFETPYTFPLEITLEQLSSKATPEKNLIDAKGKKSKK